MCFSSRTELFSNTLATGQEKNDVDILGCLIMCKCYLPWSHILGSTSLIHIIYGFLEILLVLY